MAKQQTFVTGDKELDRLLKGLPQKLRKKYMRKATRDAAKEDLKEWRNEVETETGALRDSPKVRAIKRARGAVGHQITIDREKLILERAARGGKIGYDRKRNEPFFYAAIVELDPQGNKALRSVLYGNADRTRQKIIDGLKEMIRDAAKLAKLKPGDALPPGFKFDALGRLRDAKGRFL